jgi:hypothetical protein
LPAPPAPRAGGILGGIGSAVRSLFRKEDDGGAADFDDEDVTGAGVAGEVLAEPVTERATATKQKKSEEVERRRGPSPAKPEAPSTGRRGARRLRAVVKLRRGRTLVLEIVVPAGEELEWRAGTRAQVALSDGATSEAAVDGGKTTRPGRYAAGQAVRLVIELGDDTTAMPIGITVGDLALEVVAA